MPHRLPLLPVFLPVPSHRVHGPNGHHHTRTAHATMTAITITTTLSTLR
jgi:hypothetical protein